MGIRTLAAGMVLSLAVTSAWACTTAVTSAGPAPVLHLTGSPVSDYLQLASGATGSARALFAVLCLIYAVCLAATGYRRMRR